MLYFLITVQNAGAPLNINGKYIRNTVDFEGIVSSILRGDNFKLYFSLPYGVYFDVSMCYVYRSPDINACTQSTPIINGSSTPLRIFRVKKV